MRKLLIHDNKVENAYKNNWYLLEKLGMNALFSGAGSCGDLRSNHGITRTGYYLMKVRGFSKNEPSYRYCDFKVYQGVLCVCVLQPQLS